MSPVELIRAEPLGGPVPPSPVLRAGGGRRGRRREPLRARRGFTLIEVLATVALIAIVLPVVMRGVTIAMTSADAAKQRSEAVALAEAKLNELVSTQQWQTGNLSGDFGEDWSKYRWTADVQEWDQSTGADNGVEQFNVHVTWTSRNTQREVVLSTLVYISTASSSGSSGTSGSTTP